MKIVIANNMSPFEAGGAELLANSLAHHLELAGHESDIVRVPLDYSRPSRVLQSAAAARLMRIPNADRVIALKFPAYLIQHPNKRIWLFHQFRQVYELWGSPAGWASSPDTERVRNAIRDLDAASFAESKETFCISRQIQSRLEEHSGVKSKVLMSPPHRISTTEPADYGDYLLAPGRIARGKRQDLAVQAMRYVSRGLRLIVAGPIGNDEAYLRELVELTERDGTKDRVEFRIGFHPAEALDQLIAGARGVFYAPYEEDSYGYVSYEAAQMRRPIVTTVDSGGVLDLVENGVGGLVVEPTARQVAQAFLRLDDSQIARRLGEGAKVSADDLDLSWNRIVGELTR